MLLLARRSMLGEATTDKQEGFDSDSEQGGSASLVRLKPGTGQPRREDMGRGITDERGSTLTIVAEILGIVTALIALWEFGARVGLIPGPSPVQRVQEVIEDDSDGDGPPVPAPTTPTPDGQETRSLGVLPSRSTSSGFA